MRKRYYLWALALTAACSSSSTTIPLPQPGSGVDDDAAIMAGGAAPPVVHLLDAGARLPDTAVPGVDADEPPPDVDGGVVDAEPGAPDAAEDAQKPPQDSGALDAQPDVDMPPMPDDEGTCDACWLDEDCPPTHTCASDGVTNGVTFCMPKGSFCSGQTPGEPRPIPPFPGGEYLSGYRSCCGCLPEDEAGPGLGTLIGCGAWRQLVGIPE